MESALCFKVRCFVFEKHRKFYLSSKIFFIFFTLKHGKLWFQRWNCSCRASKSRGNTATEGWKRTGTFPLTFTFADKHGGCNGNGLIDVAEKFEFGACSIWIVEDVGRGSFLFPTYQGRPGGVVYPKKIRQNTQKYPKFIQMYPKLYPGILYTRNSKKVIYRTPVFKLQYTVYPI